jgi:hypothetical protein
MLAIAIAVFPGAGPSVSGAAAVPHNTALPTIAGTLQVGQDWTVTPGSWTLSPVLTYQWYRDAAPIGGETATTYTLAAADIGHTIKCRESDSVSGTHADSTASSTVLSNDASLSVLTVATALLSTVAWTDGQTKECDASATSATIVATPTNGGASRTINGADSPVTIAAGANTITVVVMAADGITTANYVLTLNATGVAPADGLLAPTIDNTTPKAGDILGVSTNDTGSRATSYDYAWLSDITLVGTNSASYTPQRSDMGKGITCTVTPINAWGSGTPVATSPTAAVTAVPLFTVAPIITTDGAALVGINAPNGPADAFGPPNNTTADTLLGDGTGGSTAAVATGYPTPALTYSWVNATISPGTSPTQLLDATATDPAHLHVVATNSVGSDSVDSNNMAIEFV